jgi:hypothetical protein
MGRNDSVIVLQDNSLQLEGPLPFLVQILGLLFTGKKGEVSGLSLWLKEIGTQ